MAEDKQNDDEEQEINNLPNLAERIISLEDWWKKETTAAAAATIKTDSVSSVAAATTTSNVNKRRCISNEVEPLLLMDLRSSEDYQSHHLYFECEENNNNNTNNNSCNSKNKYILHSQKIAPVVVVPFPIECVQERSFELPARHVEFSILLHRSDIERAEAFLLRPRSISKGKKRSKTVMKLWKVKHVLVDNPELWDQARKLGICREKEKSNGSRNVASLNNSISCSHEDKYGHTPPPLVFSPFSRLWQPDPMVQNVLLPLLREELDSKISSDVCCNNAAENNPLQSNNAIDRGNATTNGNSDRNNEIWEVWDMASGAGRDVAFLGEEMLAYSSSKEIEKSSCIKVTGFDHRYKKKEKETVTNFWDRRGIANQTNCVQMDVSKWGNLEKYMQKPTAKEFSQANDTDPILNHLSRPDEYHRLLLCLFCVRFWKPELVADIAKSSILRSGTIFGISHFCKPYDGAKWIFDHPSEKTVIERNHLNQLFQESSKWEILHDEIAMDSDHGRTMIHFIARKK